MAKLRRISNPGLTSGFNQYFIAVAVIGVTALLCRPLSDQQGYYIVSFVLLFVVSVMAVFLGIGPILLASTVSALVWNFFFIPPHYKLHIERTEDKLMFVSFFFIALINGVLTNRIRRQEKLALEREERTKAIFELTRELSNTSGVVEILEVACRDIRKYFGAWPVYFLTKKENRIEILGKRADETHAAEIDNSIANWVFRNAMKGGRFTEFYSDTDLTYYPLSGKRISPGVIAVAFEKHLSADKEMFWQAYLTQISNALERELLGELAMKARILDESDRLYKTLFTLISHEFRIPIATIMGAADTFLMPRTTDNDKILLFDEISKASARLNHLVENLLNMSRLESGKISLHPDWCDLNDLVNKVSRILKLELTNYELERSIPPEMPLVKLDFGLTEQIIYNLILNACQYTPAGSVIRFETNYRNNNLYITVEDNGPGFPQDFLNRIFNKFARADSSRAGGLGLGLSIVKGLVEAHHGTVNAENKKSGGARIIISIPVEIADITNIQIEE